MPNYGSCSGDDQIKRRAIEDVELDAQSILAAGARSLLDGAQVDLMLE